MAWYTFIYACGHDGREQFYGKHEKRERMIAARERSICPECEKQRLAERREAEAQQAAAEAQEQGLPQLVGTPKQVAFGERCRMTLIKKLQSVFDRIEQMNEYTRKDFEREYKRSVRKPFDLDRLQHGYQVILSLDSAAWWIDQALSKETALVIDLVKLIEQHADEPAQSVDKEVLAAIDAETTVRPETPVSETVALIKEKDGEITIEFPERRDDFREIVKDRLKMRWNGYCWARKIDFWSGPVADRIAEAGHRLLAAGFVIRIHDQALRERAIRAEYAPEQTRWITTRSAGEYAGRFAIFWGRHEDFYSAARRIPGSRWDSPYVCVPPEQFEQLLDFAERYGFRLTDNAMKLADDARAKKEQMLTAAVPPVIEPEPVEVSGIPPKLEVPKEVEADEEFRDDD